MVLNFTQVCKMHSCCFFWASLKGLLFWHVVSLLRTGQNPSLHFFVSVIFLVVWWVVVHLPIGCVFGVSIVAFLHEFFLKDGVFLLDGFFQGLTSRWPGSNATSGRPSSSTSFSSSKSAFFWCFVWSFFCFRPWPWWGPWRLRMGCQRISLRKQIPRAVHWMLCSWGPRRWRRTMSGALRISLPGNKINLYIFLAFLNKTFEGYDLVMFSDFSSNSKAISCNKHSKCGKGGVCDPESQRCMCKYGQCEIQGRCKPWVVNGPATRWCSQDTGQKCGPGKACPGDQGVCSKDGRCMCRGEMCARDGRCMLPPKLQAAGFTYQKHTKLQRRKSNFKCHSSSQCPSLKSGPLTCQSHKCYCLDGFVWNRKAQMCMPWADPPKSKPHGHAAPTTAAPTAAPTTAAPSPASTTAPWWAQTPTPWWAQTPAPWWVQTAAPWWVQTTAAPTTAAPTTAKPTAQATEAPTGSSAPEMDISKMVARLQVVSLVGYCCQMCSDVSATPILVLLQVTCCWPYLKKS